MKLKELKTFLNTALESYPDHQIKSILVTNGCKFSNLSMNWVSYDELQIGNTFLLNKIAEFLKYVAENPKVNYTTASGVARELLRELNLNESSMADGIAPA